MGSGSAKQAAIVPKLSVASRDTQLLQRSCACGPETDCERCDEAGQLQRSPAATELPSGPGLPTAPPIVHQVLRSPGQPLDSAVSATAGHAFGFDFSRVRVHADDSAGRSAAAVSARAYTVGQHVVFAAGQYRPEAPEGRALLAHELTHVRQQASQQPTSGELVIGDPDTAAEQEAHSAARDVMTGSAAAASARLDAQPILQRDLQSGLVLGGIGLVGGAAIGAAIGAFAGPLGILAGAIIGGVVGGAALGLIGGLGLKRDAKGESEAALAQVHQLLATSFLHPVVTEDDAHKAFAVLLTLGPVARLKAYQELLDSGEWDVLDKKLPQADREALMYWEGSVSPMGGPVMPGDVFSLELTDLVEETRPSIFDAPPVASDGLHAPDLPRDAPAYVVGLGIEDAKQAIAAAYGEAQAQDHAEIWIKLKSRGEAYGRMAGASVSDEGTWQPIKPSSDATIALRKASTFKLFIKQQAGSVRPEVATAFKAEMAARLDRYETPEQLLNFVESTAPAPQPSGPDPEQEWRLMSQSISKSLLDSKDTGPFGADLLRSAYAGFQKLYDAYRAKGELNKHDPAEAWGRALREAGVAARAQFTMDELRKLEEKHKDEAANKAVENMADLYVYVANNIAQSPVPLYSYAADKERGIGYNIWRSKAEEELRKTMANEIISWARAHMNDPGFAKLSPVEVVSDWMANHRTAATILQFAASHPEVTKESIPIEIPQWQTASEMVVGFIPIVGSIVGAYEVISGEDMFGHKLGTVERVVIGAAILLPAAAKVFKLGRGALAAATLVREYGLVEREAAAVYKALVPLKPGGAGYALLFGAAEDVRAGKKIDAAQAKELEKLLQEMGMTDKAQAQALSQAAIKDAGNAEARIGGAIERDIEKLGPLNPETKDVLRKEPEVVESLLMHPKAERVLESCRSICFPAGLTQAQIEEIDRHLLRLEKTGKLDEKLIEDYIYANRSDLNKAIVQIAIAEDAAALHAKLPFLTQTALKAPAGAAPLSAIGQAATSAKALAGKKAGSAALGAIEGRAQALLESKLDVNFQNPFEHIGRYGQGFDDIMASGANLNDKSTIIYILEYKGGGATLQGDQMQLSWIIRNINRLYQQGGTDGRKWAAILSKALSEGRIEGVVYSTKSVGAATIVDVMPAYKRTVLTFTP